MNSLTIEDDRLTLLIDRDGLQAAVAFAKQTMGIYRTCFFTRTKNGQKHYCHDKKYRRSFIESYLAFKRFYLQHKEQS